jgi:branched-chain amino acid transport system substrate-binding protein
MRRFTIRSVPWRYVAGTTAVIAAVSAAGVSAAMGGTSQKSATPIKIGIVSDCQGAFGSFYNQDLAGAIAAFSEFTGAKPKNPNNPSAGMVGGSIGGHPIQIVGFGCGNDRADVIITQTRRLMEQKGAQILIGPLSGDESIAIAQYAKAHQQWTFVDGAAGAQDTTLKVQAPNFFRFNGDGAMWNAGLGDYAVRKLGWKNAAVISDDYSFAWTSTAGFIADFCAAGGNITKRVFPPLNTTDYSSYVQQLPELGSGATQTNGIFWAVGGSGLISALKAYETAKGPIDSKRTVGNLFWGTPGEFEALSNDVAGTYVGLGEQSPDLKTANALKYNKQIEKWFKTIPPFGSSKGQAASIFVYDYFVNTWGLIKGLQAVNGDLSNNQAALKKALAKVTLTTGYSNMRLDANRHAIEDVYIGQLYKDSAGKLSLRTVAKVPQVTQAFGGVFSHTTPAPGRTFPGCVHKKLPWTGKEIPVVNGIPKA